VKAERTVIGTRRSSCVASWKVVLVVDREEVLCREDARRKKEKKQYEHVMTGAPTRSFPLRSTRGFRCTPYSTAVAQMNLKGYVGLIHHPSETFTISSRRVTTKLGIKRKG
jgi:hypothetical protein